MITKERLKELIEQEETVWCVSELCGSNKLKLHNKDVKYSDCFHISKTLLLSDSIEFYDEEGTYRVPFQLLFETKEDAEWYHEFANVERTERLIFPTWEEFKEFAQFSFYDLDRFFRYFVYFDLKNIVIKEYYEGGARVIFSEPLTKENFILACRKCKELFLNGGGNDTN